MKTSSTALLATMAAASTPAALAATLRESGANENRSSNEVSASTSSTSGRQLDGKSGKATKASFPATPENYEWIVGEYDPADLNLPIDYHQVTLEDGEPIQERRSLLESEEPSGPPPKYYPARLGIKPLRDYPSLVFQATLDFKIFDTNLEAREVLEGVGSFNPAKVYQITFYADHKEYLNTTSGEWVQKTFQKYADNTVLECSKVLEYPDGENIVCEYYGNNVFDFTMFGFGLFHSEGISTSAWTKQLLPMD